MSWVYIQNSRYLFTVIVRYQKSKISTEREIFLHRIVCEMNEEFSVK